MAAHIRVMVPATTANLGPGFDCLGMALDMWNEVHIETSTQGDQEQVGWSRPLVSVQGNGATELPSDESNLVYCSIVHLFTEAHLDIPRLRIQCHNNVPLKRGLGSSAAAIVGGLVAANLLLPTVPESAGRSFTMGELLDMAVHLEGHLDNVAPALLGGLQLVVREGNELLSSTVRLPKDIRAVLFIPEATIATEEARAVLPKRVSMADAVYNMGRVALLVNALATGRLDDLRLATKDRLHQPFRQKLFPPMKVIFAAALSAGALGVFLSGSGSTILALTRGREMTVAYEMAEAARQSGTTGQVKITRPSLKGAHPIGPGARETSN